MAYRPIYISTGNTYQPFKEEIIKFDWVSGLSYQQKCKRRDELAKSISKNYDINNWLEVSTKSDKLLGILLSAKNLELTLTNENKYTVEKIYQYSKIYDNNKLIEYNFHGNIYPNEPYGLFYDHLYMMALYQNKTLYNELNRYNIFTDIEFNHNRQLNTQARAIAIFKTLLDNNQIDIITNKNNFIDYYKNNVQLKRVK